MQRGIPLEIRRSVIPVDDTTLFVCSGMQNLRSRFRNPDGTTDGSIQSCIRTNDLDLVGDGSHATLIEMVGTFSFGRSDYEDSVELWHQIVRRLSLPVTHVTVHPTRDDHRRLWVQRGYRVIPDLECVWSDGDIGGNCCELFVGDLEIGNLVNPQDVSTDVGFGLERLLQVIEGVSRIDEISVYDQRWDPVVRDHVRTLSLLWEQDIGPGNRGRSYVCRRLLRRVLRRITGNEPGIEELSFLAWLDQERELRRRALDRGRSLWRRHRDKPPQWWWETTGLLPEELHLLDPG